MNPSPVGTPTAPNPNQRRATSPAAASLDVWIRLPNLNHELPAAEVATPAVEETISAEPVRHAVAQAPPAQTQPTQTQPQSESTVGLSRRTMYSPQLMSEGRSISPVALLTGIVAATALFCLLLVGGKKTPAEKSSAEKPAIEKPAATDNASTLAENAESNAKSVDAKVEDKGKDDAAKTADAKETKKKKKKPDAPTSDGAPKAEEPVIGVTPWPRKDPAAQAASHETAVGGPAPVNNVGVEFAEPATTPWPQREAQLPPEYRNVAPPVEFEGTIQKPEYRAEHDRIRSSLH